MRGREKKRQWVGEKGGGREKMQRDGPQRKNSRCLPRGVQKN